MTIAVQGRQCLFGQILDGLADLNQYGEIVREEWERCAQIRSEIELDEFVVMPNHLHGIVVILPSGDGHKGAITVDSEPDTSSVHSVTPIVASTTVGAKGPSPLPMNRPAGMQPRSLGSFVAGFKSASTTRINAVRGVPSTRIWQRNYYEHVIRNDQSLSELRSYIETNPNKWELDQLLPENPSKW